MFNPWGTTPTCVRSVSVPNAFEPNTQLEGRLTQVDLRLTKAFRMTRGAQLSLIAEAFNVFNTENYSGYFSVQRSPTGEPRPDFRSPSGIFATRQFQLGTRLQF